MTDRGYDADVALLTSLTKLILRWSSLDCQREVTSGVGLDLDDRAVSAVYALGLLGEARVSTIADELHLSRPTASKLVARLERAGLIQRTSDELDARAHRVTLTNLGRDAFGRLVEAGVQLVRSATTGWPNADHQRLAELLESFVDQLVDERPLTTFEATRVSQQRVVTPPSGKEE